jgi:hypothetical protein
MSLEICHRHFDDRRSGCLDLFLGHGIKPRSLTVVVRRDERPSMSIVSMVRMA